VLFKRWNPRDSLYFALIGIGEILIFFRNPGHFFIADTVLWMGYRYRAVGELFRGFIATDPALWYRPLSQSTVESLAVLCDSLHLPRIRDRVSSYSFDPYPAACRKSGNRVTERLSARSRDKRFGHRDAPCKETILVKV
jgi:hypothetical protein